MHKKVYVWCLTSLLVLGAIGALQACSKEDAVSAGSAIPKLEVNCGGSACIR